MGHHTCECCVVQSNQLWYTKIHTQLPKPGGVAGHDFSVFLACFRMVHETRSTRYPTPEALRPSAEAPHDPLQEEYPQVPEVPFDDVAAAAAAEPLGGVGRSPSVASTVVLGADASMGTPSLPLQSTPTVPSPDTMRTDGTRKLALEGELEEARAEVAVLGRRLQQVLKDKETDDERAMELASELTCREQQLERA